MTQDIAFLERADYMQNGRMKYDVFCPVTDTVSKKKKLGNGGTKKRRTGQVEVEEGGEAEPTPAPTDHSALYHQYCPELHKMVAYMRRLDGAYPDTHKGQKIMDPLAPDGLPKWGLNGRSATPLFGWWAYLAYEKALCPVFAKVMGTIVIIKDEDDVEQLDQLEVMV
jgi:hypothetical protein